jgi:hypothetical protein
MNGKRGGLRVGKRRWLKDGEKGKGLRVGKKWRVMDGKKGRVRSCKKGWVKGYGWGKGED